jgi:hypothetical protein
MSNNIDPGTEEKLEKLVKLLSSDKDGEVLAAVHAIRRTLKSSGADIHEFAARIKGGGKLEEPQSEAYPKETATPSWYDMALACAERDGDRLNSREREFVDDMVRWTARREPSEKQGKWLHALYCRLERRR